MAELSLPCTYQTRLVHLKLRHCHRHLRGQASAKPNGYHPHSILWCVTCLLSSSSATDYVYQVVGAQGTGKTSLLRLLLETADISPTATASQRSAMSTFMNAGTTRTQSIQTACVEICESRYDRVLLSVVDTPGLYDFSLWDYFWFLTNPSIQIATLVKVAN